MTIVLVLLAVLFADSSHQAPTQESTPTVSYCDLVRNPHAYVGKTVRVKATWEWGFEWSYLYDLECMNRNNRAWTDSVDSDQLCSVAKRNMKKLKDTGFNSKADVTVVGKLYDEGGYGHMNGYKYKFVISCLESVKQVPSNAP